MMNKFVEKGRVLVQNYEAEFRNAIHSFLVSWQAGCVHFPPAHQCEVKVLLLIFSPRKKAFVGLIPHDQGSFVIGIRSVVAGHRSAQIKKVSQLFNICCHKFGHFLVKYGCSY